MDQSQHNERRERPPDGHARWTAAPGPDHTVLELHTGDQVPWTATVPFGTASLGPAPGLEAVVTLANCIHAWLDGRVPRTLAETSEPLRVHGVAPLTQWHRWRRVTSAADVRASAEHLRAGSAPSDAMATAVLLDCLLDHLGVDGLTYASRSRTRDRAGRRRGARRSLGVAAIVLVTLAASVVAATQAVMTDQVAMAAVTAEGGTLDIKVDSNTTTGQDGEAATPANWGTFSASIELMEPGEVQYADITLRNPGTLPALVTMSTTGSDTHGDYPLSHCFGFWFRERSGGADVASIGDGTSLGTSEANTGVVLFHTATGPSQLYVDGATRSDATWSSAGSRTYRLSVRMLDGCQQGGEATAGATGTLTFSFDAVQA